MGGRGAQVHLHCAVVGEQADRQSMTADKPGAKQHDRSAAGDQDSLVVDHCALNSKAKCEWRIANGRVASRATIGAFLTGPAGKAKNATPWKVQQQDDRRWVNESRLPSAICAAGSARLMPPANCSASMPRSIGILSLARSHG